MSGPGLALIKSTADANPEVRRALARLSQREHVATDEGIGVGADGRLKVFPHGASTPIRNVSSGPVTVTDDDFTLNCSGTFTVNLLTAVGRSGRVWIVANSGGGTITTAGTGTDTVGGAATQTVAAGTTKRFQSDGISNFVLI